MILFVLIVFFFSSSFVFDCFFFFASSLLSLSRFSRSCCFEVSDHLLCCNKNDRAREEWMLNQHSL